MGSEPDPSDEVIAGLHALSEAAFQRFAQSYSYSDLDDAITHGLRLLALCAPGKRPPWYASRLGALYAVRYEAFHQETDLHASLVLASEAFLTIDLEDQDSVQSIGHMFMGCLLSIPDTSTAGAAAAEAIGGAMKNPGLKPDGPFRMMGMIVGLFDQTGRLCHLALATRLLQSLDFGDVPTGLLVADLVIKWTGHESELLDDPRLTEYDCVALIDIFTSSIKEFGKSEILDLLAHHLMRLVITWYSRRFGRTSEDFHKIISKIEPFYGDLPMPGRLQLIAAMSGLYVKRFTRDPEARRGDEMVSVQRILVEANPEMVPALANVLVTRSKRTGGLADVDEAISLLTERWPQAGDPGPAEVGILVDALLVRYRATRSPDDLMRAVQQMEKVEVSAVDTDILRQGFAALAVHIGAFAIGSASSFPRDLAPRLCDVCERAALLADDEQTTTRLIALGDWAVEHGAPAPPLSPQIEQIRAALTEAIARNDLDSCYQLQDKAYSVFAESAGSDAFASKVYARGYMQKVGGNAGSPDVWLAAAALYANLAAAPEDIRWAWGLAELLFLRYSTTARKFDLDEAARLIEGALPSAVGRSARARLLDHLSGIRAALYQRSGDMTQLNASISAMRQAVDLWPENSPQLQTALVNLSHKLSVRHRLLGARVDADDGLRLCERGVALLNDETPWLARLVIQNSLAGFYRMRYELDQDDTDLDRAQKALRAALTAAPEGAAERATIEHNLGAMLVQRMNHDPSAVDLDEMVSLLRAATSHTPVVHPERINRLKTLAGGLMFRADSAQAQPTDRAEAARVFRDCLASYEPTEPARFDAAINLADLLASDDTTADEAAKFRQEVLGSALAPAQLRLHAGIRLAMDAEARAPVSEALTAWGQVMRLLGIVAWRGLPREDQERFLATYQGYVSRAAEFAISAGEPVRALELLEIGRSVLWRQMIEPQAVSDEQSTLGTKLRALDDEIKQAQSTSEVSLDELITLGRRWEVLARQRAAELAGRPSVEGAGLDDLVQRIDEDVAVVVNVVSNRCDAILVESNSVRVVELPNLQADDVVHWCGVFLTALEAQQLGGAAAYIEAQEAVGALLDWLWHTLVQPVLAAAGQIGGRVFWCPTGYLSILPLHAATDAATGTSCLDLAVSSYVPNLQSLTSALLRMPSDDRGIDKLLIVAVDDHPEAKPLAAVKTEIAGIEALLPDTAHTRLPNLRATRDTVRQELGRHRFVHFACHGVHDPNDPSHGGVVLSDGVLTVMDIARVRLPEAELAYLSACRTASGGARLADESIHLGAALFLVGFRQVVGTLWAVADSHAADAAKAFYRHLARPETAAAPVAVRAVAREMRARSPREPLAWAGYIHIGV